jgi:hypothetical protein
MSFLSAVVIFLITGNAILSAQTTQPVIVEYAGKADGKIEITNNTLSPMAVILEPKSFSIGPDGRGIFRDLDKGIHLKLSSMSLQLYPKQTYYVFYKATADKLPAWFTVYVTFSSLRHSEGLDVRLMLPHTVYLYQKQVLTEEEVQVRGLLYDPDTKKLTCDIENSGAGLARVQYVHVTGGHALAEATGFPLLPGGSRHVEIAWKEEYPPTEIDFRFNHFSLKRPIDFRN